MTNSPLRKKFGYTVLILLVLVLVGAVYPFLRYCQTLREYRVDDPLLKNTMKMLGLAFHNYQERHGSLPGNIRDASTGQNLLSWRVRLAEEWNQTLPDFQNSEAWDAPGNGALTGYLPSMYRHAGNSTPVTLSDQRETGLTTALGVKNPSGNWNGTDPDSEPVLYINGKPVLCVGVAAAERVPWTKPVDYSISEVIDQLQQDQGSTSPIILYALFADGYVIEPPFTWKLSEPE
ncbi:hypothetical protein Enr10x_60560 [Gimesia panareensis]|uniref:DUF1559 domain-containing protein n=1 Tax=Gimesia panareensis TaxID=2527978 RepID=A0A517QGC1_9PLAN|nr:DUF1559 domain-containing protein [Gimesia panareensis]QDT30688.1 hypothetical protein Enr10x_60560 [Gimesia panareensis]